MMGNGRHHLFGIVATFALLHVTMNIRLSTIGGGASSSFTSWDEFPWPSSITSSSSSMHSSSLMKISNADEIMRRSYDATFGALSLETLCPPNVRHIDCRDRLLTEVRQLSHLTTDKANDNSSGNGGNDQKKRTMSFPWWFITMLRDAPVRASWHNLTIMDPPMDICTIEKVATTQWRNVQCVLNDNMNITPRVKPCQLNQTRLDLRQNRAMKQGGRIVSRTVILRDPLERMLSGYLDKCVKLISRKYEGHCEPNSIFNGTDLTVRIRDDPKQLFAAYIDSFPLKWNVHFFPQSLYCDGLYRHVKSYDFVGYMDAEFHDELRLLAMTINDDKLTDTLVKVFHLPNIDDEKSTSLSGGVAASKDVDFSKGAFKLPKGYDRARHPTNAPSFVKDYFTAESVRRALEYFAVDYVMLGLEVPGWAHDMLAKDANLFPA